MKTAKLEQLFKTHFPQSTYSDTLFTPTNNGFDNVLNQTASTFVTQLKTFLADIARSNHSQPEHDLNTDEFLKLISIIHGPAQKWSKEPFI